MSLAQLFNLLLINVTSFFRDPAAWQALAGRLPAIVGPHADTPIRAWSAGCSSGEEPYTLAMAPLRGARRGRLSRAA
ncbi:MAG: hypothetical protein KF850_37745 [Labilithrix sp.]|nr:hypothetical protein [Labilithrix sp.]